MSSARPDPQPDYDVPRLPEDITACSDTALMNHLRMQVEWQNFFATKVVELEMAEADAEQEYETAKAVAYLAEGKKTVTESKAARDGDPVVVKKRAAWRTAKTERKAMQVVMDNRDRTASVLSREVTRRVGREPHQRRSDRSSG